MNQHWQQAVLKLDALSLRERVIIFILAAVVIICLFTILVFDQQFAQRKLLSNQIRDAATRIELARNEVKVGLIRYQDTDTNNQERLKALQKELPLMHEALADMQKGLISPDKMTMLLHGILKRDLGSKLVSLKTLPVQNLVAQGVTDMATSNNKQVVLPGAASLITKPDTAAVYSHGVEIVLQGNYLEIMDYVKQIENMPWQLLWGKAKLEVNEYPTATMTLTLYSLSLDKKWLHL